MFGITDQNNDGVIAADEAAARRESVFVAIDADDDGALTEEEYMAVRMGPGAGRGPRHEARQELNRARFKVMDKNKDGKVTKAEFIEGGRVQFEAADANKDGKVTPWEFRANRRY
jgi:Ca2+-binding EF-hand superfamily protein